MKHTSIIAIKAIAKLAVFLFCFPFFCISQNNSTVSKKTTQTFPTWEAGAFFGFGWMYGDLVTDIKFSSSTTQPGYGLMAVRNFNPNWAIRANLFHVKLKANDLDSKLAGHRARGFSHETPLTELSILAQWDMRGKRRYKRVASFKKTVSPYFFAGLAGGLGKPEVFYDDRKDDPLVLADQKNTSNFRVAIPFGGGVKIDLSQRSFVGLEFGFRPTFGDLLDGVSESGNADKNDWYAFGGMTVGYRFITDDADGDGVVDDKDKCPGVAGERRFRGCPDTDGDGVRDNDDECPLIAGAKTMKGCPDSDLDGVTDTEDECPNTKGMRRLQGCPDADWDNVIDKNDACPNTPGLVEFRGCPDTDKDGVMDLEDKCPDIKGEIKFEGCPEGEVVVEEEISPTPEEVPTVETPSEPIAVTDAVIKDLQESVLEMPETAAPIEEEIVIVADEILTPPIENIEMPTFDVIRFATAKNDLLPADKRILDNIIAEFSNYPNATLKIIGYTDNVGNENLNQQLSEKRAKACFDYLVAQGVDANRMSYKGLGEINPMVPNDTVVGRAENRRVELTISNM